MIIFQYINVSLNGKIGGGMVVHKIMHHILYHQLVFSLFRLCAPCHGICYWILDN